MVAEACADGPSTLARALALAGKIAANAPVAVRATVRTLRAASDSEGLTLARALAREADAQAIC
jgi:enoyl-CoA hydratase/carnithine racemase